MLSGTPMRARLWHTQFFFNGNELLFHWVFRGYRSDSDLSVAAVLR